MSDGEEPCGGTTVDVTPGDFGCKTSQLRYIADNAADLLTITAAYRIGSFEEYVCDGTTQNSSHKSGRAALASARNFRPSPRRALCDRHSRNRLLHPDRRRLRLHCRPLPPRQHPATKRISSYKQLRTRTIEPGTNRWPPRAAQPDT